MPQQRLFANQLIIQYRHKFTFKGEHKTVNEQQRNILILEYWAESKYDTDAIIEDFENIGEYNIISYIDDDNDYDLFSMIDKCMKHYKI